MIMYSSIYESVNITECCDNMSYIVSLVKGKNNKLEFYFLKTV